MKKENLKKKSQTQGVLAQSPEPEAYDKVLDNSIARSNWNLGMLIFEERGLNRSTRRKTSRARKTTNNKLNPQ